MAGLSDHFLRINGVKPAAKSTPKSQTRPTGISGETKTSNAHPTNTQPVQTQTQNEQAFSAPTKNEKILNSPTILERQLGIRSPAQTPQRSATTARSPAVATASPAFSPTNPAIAQTSAVVSPSVAQSDPPIAASVPQFGGLDASDRKFFAMSPNEGALQQFDDKYQDQTQAQTLIAQIQSETTVIVDTDQSKGDRSDAIISSATQVETLSEIESPGVREAALAHVNTDLRALGANVDILGGDETRTVIGQITRATENLGTDHGALIAAPFSGGLHHDSPWRSAVNSRELSEAVTGSIENGDGALFAVLTTEQLGYDKPLRNTIAEAGGRGIQTLNENFADAREKKLALEQEVTGFITEFSGPLTEQQLNDGSNAVAEKHQETLENYEAAADALNTTLNGVSLLPRGEQLYAAGDQRELLTREGQRANDSSNETLNTEAGLARVADAIEESADGKGNFFTEYTDFFTSVTEPHEVADEFGDTILKATTARAHVLVSEDNFDGAAKLFKGFENAAPFLQVDDPAKLSALTALLENQGDASTALAPTVFATTFAETSSDIEGRIGAAGNSNAGRRLQQIGLIVGTAALISDLSLGDVDRDQAFRSVVDAAELSDDLAALLPKEKIGKEFLENFGKLAKAGVVFDVIDIANSLKERDYEEAGFGIAGLVGTLLVTSSSVGPVGTAFGAALSILAVGGSVGLAHVRKGQAEDRVEENLEAFLIGAGLEPEDAKLLRDVTGNTHESIGRIFSQIADANPALSAPDLLGLFLNPGSSSLADFGGVPFSTDGDNGLNDHRRNLVDDIEKLERNDDGSFTAESVRKAIAIIETQLGVNIRADGLTADSAIQNIESDFNKFDLDNNGLVTEDELKIFSNPLDGSAGPLTPQQTSDQNLANYFLDRENLFDRLDRGGDRAPNHDNQISREDINAVQEQNRHLTVLRDNLNLFDVGKYPGTEVDGTISVDDLKSVRDGDYPADVKAAADFIINHRGDLGIYGDITHAKVHDAWLTLNG